MSANPAAATSSSVAGPVGESWRGGIRGTPGEKTGADEMVRVLRVQAQREGLIVIAGFVLVIIAFVAKL